MRDGEFTEQRGGEWRGGWVRTKQPAGGLSHFSSTDCWWSWTSNIPLLQLWWFLNFTDMARERDLMKMSNGITTKSYETGPIWFYDYKSKADTPRIKVDLVFFIQSTTLPSWRKTVCPAVPLYWDFLLLRFFWFSPSSKGGPLKTVQRVVSKGNSNNLFIECVSIPNRFP